MKMKVIFISVLLFLTTQSTLDDLREQCKVLINNKFPEWKDEMKKLKKFFEEESEESSEENSLGEEMSDRLLAKKIAKEKTKKLSKNTLSSYICFKDDEATKLIPLFPKEKTVNFPFDNSPFISSYENKISYDDFGIKINQVKIGEKLEYKKKLDEKKNLIETNFNSLGQCAGNVGNAFENLQKILPENLHYLIQTKNGKSVSLNKIFSHTEQALLNCLNYKSTEEIIGDRKPIKEPEYILVIFSWLSPCFTCGTTLDYFLKSKIIDEISTKLFDVKKKTKVMIDEGESLEIEDEEKFRVEIMFKSALDVNNTPTNNEDPLVFK